MSAADRETFPAPEKSISRFFNSIHSHPTIAHFPLSDAKVLHVEQLCHDGQKVRLPTSEEMDTWMNLRKKLTEAQLRMGVSTDTFEIERLGSTMETLEESISDYEAAIKQKKLHM